jgi:hypothetical protein
MCSNRHGGGGGVAVGPDLLPSPDTTGQNDQLASKVESVVNVATTNASPPR